MLIIGFTPCDQQEDCSHLESSQCLDSFCICNGTRLCKQHSQIVVTKIGGKCARTEDCNIENSECSTTENECKCVSGYVKSVDDKRCLLGKLHFLQTKKKGKIVHKEIFRGSVNRKSIQFHAENYHIPGISFLHRAFAYSAGFWSSHILCYNDSNYRV